MATVHGIGGTSTLIPLEEYLKTVYRPDCDYVDGMLEERTLGEFDHANVADNLMACKKLSAIQ